MVYSYREIAELAFASLGKAPRIVRVPLWVMKALVAIARLGNRHQGALLAFFMAMMSNDMVAPRTGAHSLAAHFKEIEAME